MKTRYQSGSAHVIIVIVLVAALLGALGFIFWQNFLNKPTADNATSTTQPAMSTSSSVTEPSKSKGLVITDWKINIPITGEYTYAHTSTTNVKIISDELKKAEDVINCDEGNGVDVYRGDSLDNVGTYELQYASPKVDGYYYVLHHGSQAACVGHDGSSKVDDAYEALFDKLNAIWDDISSTN